MGSPRGESCPGGTALGTLSQRPRECFSERVRTPFPGTGETPNYTTLPPQHRAVPGAPACFHASGVVHPLESLNPFCLFREKKWFCLF